MEVRLPGMFFFTQGSKAGGKGTISSSKPLLVETFVST